MNNLITVFAGAFLIIIGTSLTGNAQSVASAATAETKFVEAGERKIAYRSFGKGTPIILANRFRGVLDTWDPLFLDNLAKNFNVIIFDYSGIGSSTGTLAPDIAVIASDVKNLAASLKLNKFIMLGWSFGGYVAQSVTLQYPELVSHLLLIGTNPPGKNEIPAEQSFFDKALKPVNDFNDEVVLFFEPKSETSVKAAKLSHDRISKRLNVPLIPSTQEVFNVYFAGGKGFVEDKLGLRNKLQTSKIPVLVLMGDHDNCFAVENWFPLLRQFPTGQLIILPQSGHGPQHQYPELSATYINSFVKNTK